MNETGVNSKMEKQKPNQIILALAPFDNYQARWNAVDMDFIKTLNVVQSMGWGQLQRQLKRSLQQ